MKIDARAFASAVSVVTVAAFLVCALLIATLPEQAWALFGILFHVDFAPIKRELGWSDFFVVPWAAGSFFVSALTAQLYNRLACV